MENPARNERHATQHYCKKQSRAYFRFQISDLKFFKVFDCGLYAARAVSEAQKTNRRSDNQDPICNLSSEILNNP